MITYNNILELIDDLPKYMIPYQYFDICWYIKLKNNKDYEIITPCGVTRNLKMQYGEYDNPKCEYYEKYNEFENFIKSFENYRFLRNGKIIFSNSRRRIKKQTPSKIVSGRYVQIHLGCRVLLIEVLLETMKFY